MKKERPRIEYDGPVAVGGMASQVARRTRIEDLGLVAEDRLALEGIASGFKDEIPSKGLKLYYFLLANKTDSGIILRKDDMQTRVAIPDAAGVSNRLKIAVQIYADIYRRLKDGWRVVDELGNERDVSKFYSAL